MKRHLLFLFGLIISTSVLADVPQGISHQAVMRDAENNLIIESPIGLQVSIIQGTHDGNAVYVEVHEVMTNANGLITYIIGNGDVVAGVFEDIDWGAGPFWLKTEADPDGGVNYTISGLSMFLSVPYALHAQSAEDYSEIDPLFTAWDRSEGIVITEEQISDLKSYLTNIFGESIDDLADVDLTGLAAGKVLKYDDNSGKWVAAEDLGITEETDPVFMAWDKSEDILISESQIEDLQAYLTDITNEAIGDLSNVDLTGLEVGKILKFDGDSNMWVVADDLGITEETDPLFSAWDKSEGIEITEEQITDLQEYLLEEADPLFTASPAATIEEDDIINWTEAHQWGDHGLEGYLTDEEDPMFMQSPAATILDDDILNWTESHSWGDHSLEEYLTDETDPIFTAWDRSEGIMISEGQISDLQDYLVEEADPLFTSTFNFDNVQHGDLLMYDGGLGQWVRFTPEYLTGFDETDPLFTASPASGILSGDIENWDAAFNWGDHGEEGYLKTETDPLFSISPAAGIAEGDIINWDEAYSWGDHDGLYRPNDWTPEWTEILNKPDFADVAFSGSYEDLIDKPQGTSPGEMKYWDGSEWLAVVPGETGQSLTFCDGVPTWGPCIYTLFMNVSPIAGGNVFGEGQYEIGQQISITAVPETGWVFTTWTGDIEYLDNAASANTIVNMPSNNISLTANFQEGDDFTPYVGQFYEGGIVAYILQPGDPGYNENKVKGLIAAPNDYGSIIWGCFGQYNEGTASLLGSGATNTAIISMLCDDNLFAAKACNELDLNSKKDWFLPSVDELDILYQNHEVIGGFSVPEDKLLYAYWSSSDNSTSQAYSQDFDGGSQGRGRKDFTRNVRCVRSFIIHENVNEYNLTLFTPHQTAGQVIGEGEYEENDQISISAIPYPGWEFAGWTGDIEYIDDPTSANTSVTMPSQNVLLIANFKEEDDSPESGTVIDIDGNVYATVVIGDQEWMAENLRVTKYKNGDAVPQLQIAKDVDKSSVGAFTIYDHSEDNTDGINSSQEMVTAYGKLYNWYAVDDSRGLCPEGWSVPTHEEWTQLGDYLETSIGGKLKSTFTEPEPHPRWDSPNSGATNETGFSGLPGGYFNYNEFKTIGHVGGWWTSTSYSPSYARHRYVTSSNTTLYSFYNYKWYAFSVRCVRNIE